MRTPLTISLVVALAFAMVSSTLAWGPKGHFMVNRLALANAASKLPPFMNAGSRDIIYNALEPDRWREEANSALNIAQAPDHFFDSEYWGDISTIPSDRFDFMAKMRSKNIDLNKTGYLPYATMENYARLRNAFRNWRNARNTQDRESAQANAIHYAGILGHYVADGTMPMHLSVHSNGWANGYANPKGFTTDRNFHSRYETAYVDVAIDDAKVKARIAATKRLDNVFAAVKAHLVQAYRELEPIYEMEKSGEFNPQSPRTKGTEIISTELARAATLLGDLWYTAWLESGEPAK